MTLTRCTFGFHLWIDPDRPQHFGDRRTCVRCGVVQELQTDESGWTAGNWVRVEKDKPSLR